MYGLSFISLKEKNFLLFLFTTFYVRVSQSMIKQPTKMYRQRSLLVGQPAPPEEDSAETGGGAQVPHLQQQGTTGSF
jgi:hypothetical protein